MLVLMGSYIFHISLVTIFSFHGLYCPRDLPYSSQRDFTAVTTSWHIELTSGNFFSVYGYRSLAAGFSSNPIHTMRVSLLQH